MGLSLSLSSLLDPGFRPEAESKWQDSVPVIEKQIDSLFRHQPANENQIRGRFRLARRASKNPRIIRIGNDRRVCLERGRNRPADRHTGGKPNEEMFDSLPEVDPLGAGAIGSLVRDDEGFPHEERRPNGAHAQIVLPENVAPSNGAKQLPEGWLTQDLVTALLRQVSRGLGQDRDRVP